MADDRMAPFSTGGFFLVQLALMIPFVNFILLLVFAFGGSVNVNLQNYSRAILIWMLIGIGLSLILGVVGAIAAGGLGAYLDNLSTQYK